jgi:DNA replication and repair protein RecF
MPARSAKRGWRANCFGLRESLGALSSHEILAGFDRASSIQLWLARLTLTNFRNHAHTTLAVEAKSAVLTGQNGSGKTNVLEAISMLSPGRGLRGAAFGDLARLQGDGGWAVAARLRRSDAEIALGTGQQVGASGSASSRVVRIDGEQSAGAGALGEHLQVLWLIPAMDGLFTGPASERRRFLDRMVASFDGAHRTRLNAYDRAMRQRNRLLEIGERSERYFAAIESQMAEIGTAIAAARIETLDRLAGLAAATPSPADGAFPQAHLALEGTLEAALRDKPAVDVEDDHARALASGRDRDRAAGRTLTGPHRADLLVRHGPKDMPAGLCSTGEQKALLIGLILAHAKAVKDARAGLAPLLLLDEIAAHLDALRREALFDEIESLGAQAWMTGTDREVFAPLQEKAEFLIVEEGAITPLHKRISRLHTKQTRLS